MPRYRRVVVAGLVALLGVAGTGAAHASTVDLNEVRHNVALGDSIAAGPFIPVQRTDPIGCVRSTHDYPALVAEGLHVAEFTDVSCSGAVTGDMTAAQALPLGDNPPQFDALRPDTDLVTVTIGGNDIGFSDIVYTCARLSFTDPLGDPCRRQATAAGTDTYAERILAAAPRVAAVLRGIQERSPDATVLVVDYLRILPPAVGCWPVVPIARGDVAYLDGLHQQISKMLAEQADVGGALLVDAYAASWGHDICQAPSERWVEGIFPTSPAFPVHPNASGMRTVADRTLETLTNSAD